MSHPRSYGAGCFEGLHFTATWLNCWGSLQCDAALSTAASLRGVCKSRGNAYELTSLMMSQLIKQIEDKDKVRTLNEKTPLNTALDYVYNYTTFDFHLPFFYTNKVWLTSETNTFHDSLFSFLSNSQLWIVMVGDWLRATTPLDSV